MTAFGDLTRSRQRARPDRIGWWTNGVPYSLTDLGGDSEAWVMQILPLQVSINVSTIKFHVLNTVGTQNAALRVALLKLVDYDKNPADSSIDTIYAGHSEWKKITPIVTGTASSNTTVFRALNVRLPRPVMLNATTDVYAVAYLPLDNQFGLGIQGKAAAYSPGGVMYLSTTSALDTSIVGYTMTAASTFYAPVCVELLDSRLDKLVL